MSLFTPKIDSDNLLEAVGISLLECDVCGNRFSSSMVYAWPFCSADVPHEKMSSKEQLRRKELIAKTPEQASISYIDKMLHLYGPSQLSVSWENQDLGEAPPIIDVHIPKEKFNIFSDHYKVMGIFIGNILGKHNWRMDDLLEYSRKAWRR